MVGHNLVVHLKNRHQVHEACANNLLSFTDSEIVNQKSSQF